MKKTNIKIFLSDCVPGLGILAITMGLYFLLKNLEPSLLFSSPLACNLIEWVLWDPKIIIFRLQDMGVSLAAGFYSICRKDSEGFKQLFKTQLSVAVITEILKHTVRRVRPNGLDNQSFPSGHTSAAFTGASYIHYHYGLIKALPAYFCASIVGNVRVHKQAHFPSDVFAGAGIAVLTAYYMVNKKPSTDSVVKNRASSDKKFKVGMNC